MTQTAIDPLVFINYRITDTLDVAVHLADDLRRELAVGQVFVDKSSIEAGGKWPDELRTAIESARVVLVLMGEDWLTVQNEHGRRRLDVADDWVRTEIATALTGNSIVIPILVGEAEPVPSAALRDLHDIQALSQIQCLQLRAEDWTHDLDTLINTLESHGFDRVNDNTRSTSRPLFPSNVPSREAAPFVGREIALKAITHQIEVSDERCVVVLKGASGVGKSELAREFARLNQRRYPGGTLFVDTSTSGAPADLARLGRDLFGLVYPSGTDLEDQCLMTLMSLGKAQTLVIYDNVAGPDSIRQWLPPHGAPCDVLLTTTWEDWDARWHAIEVLPLTEPAALQLVAELSDDELTKSYGASIVDAAVGLPVQLCPSAIALAKAARRGLLAEFGIELSDETHQSFSVPWNRINDAARLVMFGALTFSPSHIDRKELLEIIESDRGERSLAIAAVDTCLDSYLLQSGPVLRVHDLTAAFVQEQVESFRQGEMLTSLAGRRLQALHAAAVKVKENPGDTDAIACLLRFRFALNVWQRFFDDLPLNGDGISSVGSGLMHSGLFVEARPWFERAVAEAEQGDVHGRIDHASLGKSLHQVGYCYSQTGDYAEARPWFERAVAEKEQGDVHGRIDHESLGASLHLVGYCYSQTGDYAEARPWFERAVAEAEQGDVHGRIDHASLGKSLHQVGYCYSQTGDYAEARPWFERAVAEAEQGDVHGRIDHASLGKSLHQVGYCYSQTGDYAEARPWFERAVAEKEQGDVHGRIDHESLGASLHLVGYCYSQTGDYAEARPWFERAVAEKEQGDVHGRIDHASLGKSLHLVGYCYSQTGDYAEARPWFERAVAEAEQGDVHGRIDHASLGKSLHQVGYCYSQTGDYAEARPWFERAVAEKEQGDVHGRIDHASLGASLHQVGYCYSQTGDYAEARPWFERAVAEAEQGDVHGRIDHASLGKSLHLVGYCYSQTGDYAEARPWFERAVAEKEQGDVHGRIDHESLGASLHLVGYCYSQTGDYAEARPWFERAVAEKEQGDVHGRIDHESLGASLHLVGYCYSQTGDYAEARPWFERAVAEKEQGDVHGRIDHASLKVSRQRLKDTLGKP